MLIKVAVENTRSIKSAKISFEKSGICYRNNYLYKNEYINPITIYGDNGSGKSIFLESLQYLTILMNYGEKELNSTKILPDLLAFFSNDGENKVTTKAPSLSFTFKTSDGVLFTYNISCSSAFVLSERLIVNGKSILRRVNDSFTIGVSRKKETVGKSYSAVRKIGIEEYSDKNDIRSLIKQCYECMKKVIFVDCDENVYGSNFESLSPLSVMLSDRSLPKLVSEFSSLPQFCYIEKDVNGKNTIFLDFGNNRKLPLVFASDGINRENHLLSAMVVAAQDPDSVVVVDEINRSIHPLNLKGIIDRFIEKNIQMVFSCHDTSIMRSLRPDQIYFAYLKENVETIFCRLSELHPNIREVNNIESMYLKGIFDEELQRRNS